MSTCNSGRLLRGQQHTTLHTAELPEPQLASWTFHSLPPTVPKDNYFRLTAVFPAKQGHPDPPRVLLLHLLWGSALVLQTGCPSCHSAISDKALKGTQRAGPNQWPGLILSSYTAGFLMEGALLLVRQLSDPSTS